MVQPKQSPTSLRLPEATKAAVEQYATERGIPRNAAYVELLQRGLKLATGSGVPTSADMPTASGFRAVAAYEAVAAGAPTYAAAGNRAIEALQVGPTKRKPGELAKKGPKK